MSTKIFIAFMAAFLWFGEARAERPTANNVLQYIGGLGDLAFTPAGGVLLPLSVVDGMKRGSVSPILQFVLTQHTINSCTEEVMAKAPGQRDPYRVADATFKWGICFMTSCLRNTMLLQLLPMLSPKYGTQTDNDSAKLQGLLLSQQFNRQEGCNGQGDSGIDIALIQAFQ